MCWISWSWRGPCGLAGFGAVTGIGLASIWFAHDPRANAFRVCREGKPVSTPHQVRGRLFPDHALRKRKNSQSPINGARLRAEKPIFFWFLQRK
jgi:hypothetical protein